MGKLNTSTAQKSRFQVFMIDSVAVLRSRGHGFTCTAYIFYAQSSKQTKTDDVKNDSFRDC